MAPKKSTAPIDAVPEPLKKDGTKYILQVDCPAVERHGITTKQSARHIIKKDSIVTLYDDIRLGSTPTKTDKVFNADGRNLLYKFVTKISRKSFDIVETYPKRLSAQQLGRRGDISLLELIRLPKMILGQEINAYKDHRPFNLEAGTMVQIISEPFSGQTGNAISRATSSGVAFYNVGICVEKIIEVEVVGETAQRYEAFLPAP